MYINEFSYGEIESGAFHITCGTETHSLLPSKKKCVQDILSLDGVIDFGTGGYNVRVITLPIYFDGDYSDLRKNRELIIAWLADNGTPKKLIFGNDQSHYYLAKIYAQVDFTNSSDRHIGDIEFECNPPWQYMTNGTLMTPEQITFINCSTDTNQFVREFAENGSIKLCNNGTQPTKPVIKIFGYIKSGITLSYGIYSLKINTDVVYDGIAIDCENETITRMSDGANLYSFIDDHANDFFELLSGNCEIGLSMDGIGVYPKSITVIVQLSPQTGG